MENIDELKKNMEILVINKQKAKGVDDKNMRSIILFDDDIYIPVEFLGEKESAILKLAEDDSVECLKLESQYYAPVSWLEVKFKQHYALFKGIRVEVSRRYTSTEFFE